MPFHVYKRKVQDAMFGNTQNTAGVFRSMN